MTQTHDKAAPKMTRVAVRVPRATLDQIDDWVDTLGVRRSHFLGIALVAGVRSLMQASALEVTPTSEAPRRLGFCPSGNGGALHTAMDTDPIDPEALVEIVGTLKSEVASLQSEIRDLREQLRTPRTADKTDS